ncbi:hypothetical protein E2C01_045311 [Portunus trituberculatus]|uniref:Uncharacterized protein n=1 Tax=Portunus trituberculatus TaxID=210409 RepID=A0A5B7G1P6_PORTR|nr:hypothetical protein [Portunus trituberculatus]
MFLPRSKAVWGFGRVGFLNTSTIGENVVGQTLWGDGRFCDPDMTTPFLRLATGAPDPVQSFYPFRFSKNAFEIRKPSLGT